MHIEYRLKPGIFIENSSSSFYYLFPYLLLPLPVGFLDVCCCREYLHHGLLAPLHEMLTHESEREQDYRDAGEREEHGEQLRGLSGRMEVAVSYCSERHGSEIQRVHVVPAFQAAVRNSAYHKQDDDAAYQC